MKGKMSGRILISIIGVALTLWGFGDLALGIRGDRATAVITSIRRQGGERDDARPGRYTYQIGYSFAAADGSREDGSFTETQNALYQKADGTATIAIRYFPAIPRINAPEKNTHLSLRQPVLIGAGVVLLMLVTRKHGVE
jgi:hypothetical protein